MKNFGEKLKDLRHAHKLSQQEASSRIGITRSAYANYEQGLREPDLDTLKKICLLYDITADYLLGIDEN